MTFSQLSHACPHILTIAGTVAAGTPCPPCDTAEPNSPSDALYMLRVDSTALSSLGIYQGDNVLVTRTKPDVSELAYIGMCVAMVDLSGRLHYGWFRPPYLQQHDGALFCSEMEVVGIVRHLCRWF